MGELAESKLTTADEFILKHISRKRYSHIGRAKDGVLYLKLNTGYKLLNIRDYTIDSMFPQLFKNIEERRRIRNKGAIEMNELYPLTIIKDRYNGVYSGGEYTAWNLEPEEIPVQIFYDDMSCYDFWTDNKIPVGKGNTPQEAIKNLEKLLGDEK